MSRVNVTAQYLDGSSYTGWFDPEKAGCFPESIYWDGNNRRGKMSHLQAGSQCLYRTAGGRWVCHHDGHREFNGPVYYEFITDEQAREWLIENGDDEAVTQYFGELPEESGPGRPEIGGKVLLRLGEMLPRVDEWAAAKDVSRAEAVRRLLSAAMDADPV